MSNYSSDRRKFQLDHNGFGLKLHFRFAGATNNEKIDKMLKILIIKLEMENVGRLAQLWLERFLDMEEVTRSSRVSPINLRVCSRKGDRTLNFY